MRIGIVGTGPAATVHTRVFQEMPECSVDVVAGRDLEQLLQMREQQLLQGFAIELRPGIPGLGRRGARRRAGMITMSTDLGAEIEQLLQVGEVLDGAAGGFRGSSA